MKRGLYRSASGIELNADINGAINIARKAIQRGLGGFPHERLNQEVAKQYRFSFDPRGFARGVLTMPRRLKIWDQPSTLCSAVKESHVLQL